MSAVVPINAGGFRAEVCPLAARLRTELAAIVNVYADDLAGYVVVAVDSKGCWNVSWAHHRDGPIGRTMLAGLATAAIQRELVADAAACDALVRNGLRDPPPP